jgi:hypothetical protein
MQPLTVDPVTIGAAVTATLPSVPNSSILANTCLDCSVSHYEPLLLLLQSKPRP